MQTEPQHGLLNHSEVKPNAELREIQKRFSTWQIPTIVVGGIALAEVIAMIVVYYNRALPYYQQVILDAAVLTIIILPLLYLLSFRPLLNHIQQRDQTERVTQMRLRLIQFANTHSLSELLQATLDEIEALIGGTIGYFHFLEADQKTLWLQAWSTNTLGRMCKATGKDSHYPIEQAGVWADCVRQRQAVIHNDYAALPNRKGLPKGHAAIMREMAVPIMRNEKIVAILGIGNKPREFTQNDVELVATLADFAWDVIQHKQAELAILQSENKFRTLVDWTFDWELWIDPDGKLIYSSPSCERITGYTLDEFIADPDLLIRTIHSDDQFLYKEHLQLVHDETTSVDNVEYRIIARDGAEHWIDHICRPLFDANDHYLGRRVSNRDITERKRIEEEMRARNQKEKMLTQMLHNMQLDIARDLHDTVGQNISYLRMKLDHLSEKELNSKAEIEAEINNMAKVANESYDLVRGTLAVLQSQNAVDLLNLFKRYAGQVAERAGFVIEFSNRGEAQPLSSLQLRQLFYIFREALSNIEKHAHAAQVQVEMLWEAHSLTLSVADNGKSFDPIRTQPYGTHYGLRFMRERTEMLTGSLTINASPGEGTRIVVQIPLQVEQTEAHS
jgi:PAS domain S-box-containing protein